MAGAAETTEVTVAIVVKVVGPEEVPTTEIIQIKTSLKLSKKLSLTRRALSTQTYLPMRHGLAHNIGRKVAKVHTVAILLYVSGRILSLPDLLTPPTEKLASLVIKI